MSQGKKDLGRKWVYRVMYKVDGAAEWNKARPVIWGNMQVKGIDYEEAFSPVAKIVTIRTILTLVVPKGLVLHQMNVKNVFLHGDL